MEADSTGAGATPERGAPREGALAWPRGLLQGAAGGAWAGALFVVAGVYASIAGFELAWAGGIAFALIAGLGLARSRRRPPEPRHHLVTGGAARGGTIVLAVLLLLSVVVAVGLPNDINNSDIARQVASVEHAAFYQTLLTPGFFSSDGTKYDGWTFLHAAVSQASGVAPHLLVRYSKLVLLPLFVLSLYALVRLLDLTAIHLVAAVGVLLVFSGDSFRLISLGGPRSWAYVLQVQGLVYLLAAVTRGDRRGATADAARSGVLLAAGSIVHLFFAAANGLIVAFACALAVASRDRRRLLPAAVTLIATFTIVLGPYAYFKRGALPEGESRVEVADGIPTGPSDRDDADGEEALDPAPGRVELGRLVSLRWGEYGSLIPFFVAPLLWLTGTRPREAVALYLVLFAFPCAAVLIPPLYRLLVGVIAEVRLFRILPLSPAVAAIAVYGWCVAATVASASRPRRLVAALVLAVSTAVVVPSAGSAWRWYVRVYPSTIPVGTTDHSFLSIGSLLRLGTVAWPPVLATNSRMALRLASAMRRPVAFEVDGERRWATRTDVFVDDNQDPIEWEFIVKAATEPDPGTAVCAEELYTDELILCATERGRSSWSYPGRGMLMSAR